ncbi:MAG: hypothetical protein AB7U92_04495 [Piscinibacter sp.]|uniref:hypothetical protein n=1 Tax=Piscinibacter sp. TaxID=1903157 RepID=UPI003D116403
MTSAKKPSQASDRRTGRDRRKADRGSPTGRERRVGMEPRKPEISEIEVTPSEWAALEEQLKPPSKGG